MTRPICAFASHFFHYFPFLMELQRFTAEAVLSSVPHRALNAPFPVSRGIQRDGGERKAEAERRLRHLGSCI